MTDRTLLDDVPTALVVVTEMLAHEKARIEREPRRILRISANIAALSYVRAMLAKIAPEPRGAQWLRIPPGNGAYMDVMPTDAVKPLRFAASCDHDWQAYPYDDRLAVCGRLCGATKPRDGQ